MFVPFIVEKVRARSLKTIFKHLIKYCCPTWLVSRSQSDRCVGILPKCCVFHHEVREHRLHSALMGLMESKSLWDFIVSTCTCEKETVTEYVYTDLCCYKMIHTGDRFCFGWIRGSEIKKTSRKENCAYYFCKCFGYITFKWVVGETLLIYLITYLLKLFFFFS